MAAYLNLGCGDRFHPAWTNVDFTSTSRSVMAYNLRNGVPFPDETFEVIYHSHVLEHFSKSDARAFLAECRRALQTGGIIRVVVPDLENIARTYLQAMERAASGDQGWRDNYEWMMLELYEQGVRERPGGEMAGYLRRPDLPNADFVIERVAGEAQLIMDGARNDAAHQSLERQHSLARLPRRLYGLLRRNGFGREFLLRLTLGSEYEMLQLGRFRKGGEPHLWMYDRYSLIKLLQETGFRQPQPMTATRSLIPNWTDYNLDTEPQGTVYKPSSVFVEALK